MARAWIAFTVIIGLLLLPIASTTVGAEPVVIDEFVGGLTESTLEFKTALTNASLDLEIPAGADIMSAQFVLEGEAGNGSSSNKLDFNKGTVGTDVWAHYDEGQGIYPPTVHPTQHRWTAATNRDIAAIQQDDGIYWNLDTTDAGKPPFAWPIQLFRFKPNTAGADSVNVSWNGYSTCSCNKTNLFHAEIWLHNFTTSKWILVDEYSSQVKGEVWLNYSFSLPSPFVATDGSVVVAVCGIHSEWAGPMMPAFDVGHLFTDYICLDVFGDSGPQYPRDVTITIDEDVVTTLSGNVTDPVMIDDTHGLGDALQAVVDGHTVQPGNVTLDLAFTVGAPTAGKLIVRDLRVTYEPVVNEAPEYVGLAHIEIPEDSTWTEVLDLDASFHDDHNMGDLAFELAEIVSIPEDPVPLDFRMSTGTGGNRTLEVKPIKDFFGDFNLFYVTATDLFGEEVRGYINFTVTQVADWPQLDEPGTIEAFERAPLTIEMNVTDPDLPDDEFTFSDDSGYFDINATTGVIRWTPTAEQIGTHSFHVTVTDRFGLTDQVLVTVDVENSNDPPKIISSLEIDTRQGREAAYIIRAEDPDLPFGDQLQYFAFGDEIEFSIDPSSGRITFIPTNDHVPSFEITLRVQDLLGEMDEQVLLVNVENINDPPNFQVPSQITRNQNEEVIYDLVVHDPDIGLDIPEPETLTISGTGPATFLPDAAGRISFTADQSMVGQRVVTYTVRDGGGLTDVVTVTWIILDLNDPPVITSTVVSPMEAPEDTEFTLSLEAEDLDGDPLSWEDDSDLFDIDVQTGEVRFTPVQADVGSHQVTLTVSDGEASASATFTLEVTNVNDDPEITSVLPEDGSSFGSGEKIPFSAVATDEDGDALTYTWKEGSKVLGTGESLPYDGLDSGDHTITLEVTDPNGGIATSEFKVKVESVLGTSLALPIAAVVIVLALIGALLFVRSRSRRRDLEEELEEEAPAEEVTAAVDEAPVGRIEYRVTGTLETGPLEAPEVPLEEDYGEAGAPVPDAGLTEAKVYELEKAQVYKVSKDQDLDAGQDAEMDAGQDAEPDADQETDPDAERPDEE